MKQSSLGNFQNLGSWTHRAMVKRTNLVCTTFQTRRNTGVSESWQWPCTCENKDENIKIKIFINWELVLACKDQCNGWTGLGARWYNKISFFHTWTTEFLVILFMDIRIQVKSILWILCSPKDSTGIVGCRGEQTHGKGFKFYQVNLI